MTADRWLNLMALLLTIVGVWKQLKRLAQQWVLRPMFALNEQPPEEAGAAGSAQSVPDKAA